MKNKELFDRANKDKDLKLQDKLRNDYGKWCKKNHRTPLDTKSTVDWWNEEVKWQ